MANLPAKGQKGFMRWLGRQVGYVARAVKTDVSESSNTLYRHDEVKELPHPENPDLTLRRTVIDEVIRKKEEEK